jgi:cysteine desulfurase
MERELRAVCPELEMFGAGDQRLPNTSAFALPDFSAETLLMALDLQGIAISSGSACSSGKVATSHVLAAMGVAPAWSRGALRVSMGRGTTQDHVDRFCETFQKIVRTARARREASRAQNPEPAALESARARRV